MFQAATFELARIQHFKHLRTVPPLLRPKFSAHHAMHLSQEGREGGWEGREGGKKVYLLTHDKITAEPMWSC